MALNEEVLHRHLRMRNAAYSCSENIRKRVLQILNNTTLSKCYVHFNSYICDIPGKRIDTDLPCLLMPFIDREVKRKNLTLKVLPGQVENVFNRLKLITDPSDFIKIIPLGYTNSSNDELYASWKNYINFGSIKNAKFSYTKYLTWQNSGLTDSYISTPYTRDDCMNEIKDKLKSDDSTIGQKISQIVQVLIQYSDLAISTNPDDCIFFIGAPMFTSNLFYGILVVTIEVPSGKSIYQLNQKIFEEILENVKNELTREAFNIFLPTLILTQNSWEEYTIYNILKNNPTNNNLPFIQEFVKVRKDLIYSNLSNNFDLHKGNKLETSIVQLWMRRFRMKPFNLILFERSLVFRKTMVASPGMITSITKVISLNIHEPKDPPLQCVLVIAPPGSGKESMSRLIPLFSDFFWDKPIITFNMGSIIREYESVNGIMGVFGKLLQKIKDGGVIVLDELNSLDIKEQPILLRILEQGEVQNSDNFIDNSLNHENEAPKWLVIGLINEPPSKLVLEELKENVTDEKMFGQLIGTSLYEFVKKRSRLRDDLYYRIKRSGEIEIPCLNERRPDIPIIFYFILKTLLPPNRNKEIFLTTDAIEVLTSKLYNWKGNIRKLESLANEVKSELITQHAFNDIYIVDDLLIISSLNKL